MAKHRGFRLGATLVVALALGGCDLDVANPEVIDAGGIDPLADAETFSLSAQTDLFVGFSDLALYGAFFSAEAYVGAARIQTNEIGRRAVLETTIDLNDAVWAPISVAVASNERVLRLLAGTEGESTSLSVARSALNAGLALVLLAEHFCQGVILGGPPLTPEQTLDSAIVRFNRAIEVGGVASGDEAPSLVTAAQVGLARANLQKGGYAEAAAAAALVPADFVFDAIRVDDPSHLDRLGNPLLGATDDAILVVPPAYQALNDPRVPYLDLGETAQDGELPWVIQTKYTGYGDPIRLASGLEARYIGAEATLQQGDAAAALALIDERRIANGQAPFGGGDNAAVLAELMDQRAREFYLEGKHLGDFRRNPTATPYVPPAGTPYYKPVQGEFGDQTCLPVPAQEKLNNPNFPA